MELRSEWTLIKVSFIKNMFLAGNPWFDMEI